MATSEQVLSFWLDEVGPAGWYNASEALDERVRKGFGTAWDEAMEGAHGLWLTYPSGTLAYIILTDQFPRNMFRGEARAFASDRQARAAAKVAVGRDWDLTINGVARQFLYLPLMHSENLIDQDRCVRLVASRMPGETDTLRHAQAHREVIRTFGKFPFRNAALGRETQDAEAAWLASGGYGATLRALEVSAATA